MKSPAGHLLPLLHQLGTGIHSGWLLPSPSSGSLQCFGQKQQPCWSSVLVGRGKKSGRTMKRKKKEKERSDARCIISTLQKPRTCFWGEATVGKEGRMQRFVLKQKREWGSVLNPAEIHITASSFHSELLILLAKSPPCFMVLFTTAGFCALHQAHLALLMLLGAGAWPQQSRRFAKMAQLLCPTAICPAYARTCKTKFTTAADGTGLGGAEIEATAAEGSWVCQKQSSLFPSPPSPPAEQEQQEEPHGPSFPCVILKNCTSYLFFFFFNIEKSTRQKKIREFTDNMAGPRHSQHCAIYVGIPMDCLLFSM